MDNLSLADLIGDNETRKQAALAALPDEDLMFAAMVINSEPIYPGVDMKKVAADLAALFLNCKSSMGASAVASVLFEVLGPSSLVSALCVATGMDSSQRARRASAENEVSSHNVEVRHILSVPHGQVFVDAALCAEYQRMSKVVRGEYYTGLLMALIKGGTDQAVLSLLAGSSRRPVSNAALCRLVELGAVSYLNDLFDAGQVFFHGDTTVRLVIDCVSHDRVLALASDHNCSFIYRDAAMRRLSRSEVQEILDSSGHRNVRESAELVLSSKDALGNPI